MSRLEARQVHLDFHTSPFIENIGKNFNKENFQKALELGNVSSVTVFAKCHHSQCYYPSKVGKMHPNLKFDLLGRMLDAAHEIGVKAPVYITAGWSAMDAEIHPEWRAKLKDGSYGTMNMDLDKGENDIKPDCSWFDMCLNDGAYCEHIYELTDEICNRYPIVDGLFYDICFHRDACYCDECIKGMRKMGLNPENENDARKYYIIKHNDFMQKCKDILYKKHPDSSIFFNSGGADQYRPEYHSGSTHFELEDLPTAWGGYNKLPPRAKYFSNISKDYLGMTGKFHTEWGEFGGFKCKEALKYETSMMLTYGARCSIGDHLHPDGEMDLETYKNIGYAYNYVEKIEPFCYDGEETTSLGIYLSNDRDVDEGIAKILLESQYDFGVVYEDNFANYEVVIFPDCVTLSQITKERLFKYIEQGGKVVFSGNSLIENNEFIIDVGAEYVGFGEQLKDYLIIGNKVEEAMIQSPILCYYSANHLNIKDGEILAEYQLPMFDRTYGHYCGHKNTPYDKNGIRYPALIKKGNILYFAHSICKIYNDYGSIYHRQYFINGLNLLYQSKVLDVDMMSAGRVNMIRQRQNNRYCLNLMYGSPISRNRVEVIEDLPIIYNIPVKLRITERARKIYTGVSQNEILFEQQGTYLMFSVPEVNCHEVIIIEYE